MPAADAVAVVPEVMAVAVNAIQVADVVVAVKTVVKIVVVKLRRFQEFLEYEFFIAKLGYVVMPFRCK